MSFLEAIQPQPDFPRVDLTEANASYLTLALANANILKNGHRVAEKIHPMFAATHRSLAIAAENILDKPENLRAIEYGIKTLEAMSLFVNAQPLVPEHAVLEGNLIGIIKPSNLMLVQGYFEEANTGFLQETPRAAAVIAESSARFIGSQAYLAVTGGAAARQFGLDNAKD
jgi:hypothetical protein